MKSIFLGLVTLASLFCLAPSPVPLPQGASGPESSAKAELLALHQAARRAHFDRNVDALLASIAPDFISVRDGRIQVKSRDDVRRHFTEYFRDAEFSHWDDLEPPVIHVSPDGQMGWMIVRVKVAYTKPDESGKRTQTVSVIAWMSAYEKRDGKWLHIANASTFEP